MRVNEVPDWPFATDNGATKIGAGLCRSHPRKSKWIANEMLNDADWRFGAAGWSCENIGHYGLGSLYSTHSFAKMNAQSHVAMPRNYNGLHLCCGSLNQHDIIIGLLMPLLITYERPEPEEAIAAEEDNFCLCGSSMSCR
jgi:hypothetical protein